jgi:hypothetical protein
MGQPPTCWRQGVAGAAAMRRQRREQWAAEAVPLWEQWRQDPLFLFGVALYWGEGATVSRDRQCPSRQLSQSNSDPALLRVWLRWCGRFLPGVPLHCETLDGVAV